MKKLLVRSIMVCLSLALTPLFASQFQDDLNGFKGTFFVKDKVQLSLLCYYPGDKRDEVGRMYTSLMPQQYASISHDFALGQEGFDNAKRRMVVLYERYIKQDASLDKNYQLCKQLMSHIQLACAATYNVFKGINENQAFKFDFTGKKGFTKVTKEELDKIYNAVQPLAALIKDLQGSMWNRFTNKFGKKSDGELALQAIKEAVLKRAKELIQCYNNDIKKLTTKEITFKSIKI